MGLIRLFRRIGVGLLGEMDLARGWRFGCGCAPPGFGFGWCFMWWGATSQRWERARVGAGIRGLRRRFLG